jgi:hypothetical protein
MKRTLLALFALLVLSGCSNKPQHVPATRDAWYVTNDGNIIHGTLYKLREERFLDEFEDSVDALKRARQTTSTQLENHFDEVEIQIEIDKGEAQWQK